MAKDKLPYVARLTHAVRQLGKVNGLRIAEPVIPADIAQNNAETDAFITKHAAVGEYLIAAAVSKEAEARKDAAKEALYKAIPGIQATGVGVTNAWNYDNVSVSARVQKGRTSIDRQMLLSKLMTDQKLSLADATKFIESVEKTGSPVIYLTPATVSE